MAMATQGNIKFFPGMECLSASAPSVVNGGLRLCCIGSNSNNNYESYDNYNYGFECYGRKPAFYGDANYDCKLSLRFERNGRSATDRKSLLLKAKCITCVKLTEGPIHSVAQSGRGSPLLNGQVLNGN